MAVMAPDARIADMRENYPPRSAVIGWILFAQIRARYASRLNELATFWMTPPTLWIGDRAAEAHHPTP